MRILYGRVFGLGNAVMCIPAIKAISSVHGPIDVLVGSTADDYGAADVIRKLGITRLNKIYFDRVTDDVRYDIAVMAIPFDGRWQEGVHFKADMVIDGRPRPDPNAGIGLSSWTQHEAEYQMEIARELGFTDETPSTQFYSSAADGLSPDHVYLGLGFKRDQGSFWSQKHWGNERYVSFMLECKRLRPNIKFYSTGNVMDMTQVGLPITRAYEAAVNQEYPAPFSMRITTFDEAFRTASLCGSYFGNDTGMMHVAASMDMPVYAMMALPGSEIKNPPLCARRKCVSFATCISDPIAIAQDFLEFIS